MKNLFLIASGLLATQLAFAQQDDWGGKLNRFQKTKAEIAEMAARIDAVSEALLGPKPAKGEVTYVLTGTNREGGFCSFEASRTEAAPKGASSPAVSLEVDGGLMTSSKVNDPVTVDAVSVSLFANINGKETLDHQVAQDRAKIVIQHTSLDETPNGHFESQSGAEIVLDPEMAGYQAIRSVRITNHYDQQTDTHEVTDYAGSCSDLRPMMVRTSSIEKKMIAMIKAKYKKLGKGPKRLEWSDYMQCTVLSSSALHCEVSVNKLPFSDIETSHVDGEFTIENGQPARVDGVKFIYDTE